MNSVVGKVKARSDTKDVNIFFNKKALLKFLLIWIPIEALLDHLNAIAPLKDILSCSKFNIRILFTIRASRNPPDVFYWLSLCFSIHKDMNYSTLDFYRNIQNKNNIQLIMQDEIIAIVVAAIACVFLFIIIYIFSYWCRQPADTQSPFVYEDSFLSSRLASYGMLCFHFIFSCIFLVFRILQFADYVSLQFQYTQKQNERSVQMYIISMSGLQNKRRRRNDATQERDANVNYMEVLIASGPFHETS